MFSARVPKSAMVSEHAQGIKKPLAPESGTRGGAASVDTPPGHDRSLQTTQIPDLRLAQFPGCDPLGLTVVV